MPYGSVRSEQPGVSYSDLGGAFLNVLDLVLKKLYFDTHHHTCAEHDA